MIPAQVRVLDNASSGSWEVWVDPLGNGQSVNVTKFRGAPTMVESLSTTDPFGPQAATLSFLSITLLDRPGTADLWWLLPEANVDICWVSAPDTLGNQTVLYRWQGYFVSFEYGEEDAGGKLTVSCKGAMHQMDNYLAKPEYLYRPLAYEYAIYRQFSGKPDLRLSPMNHPSTSFPNWWSTQFKTSAYPSTQSYLIPQGPADGDPWSGMVTRETGKFEATLTSYIQGLLSNMFTERGQFTLLLGDDRKPVLTHRDIKTVADADTLSVHVLWPGVQMQVSIDYTQRLNVVYGQGRGLSGNTFSNMQVTADGSRTFYTPWAARRDVFPADPNANPWFEPTRMRKEVSLSFSQGIEAAEATDVARKHLQRFSDPGMTAQLTLKTDPVLNGVPYPRQMVQAGQTIEVQGLFGDNHLFHITESTLNGDGTLNLTLDSKYRDQLTVQEVRKRGRDSLVPVRMLSVGQYQPLIPDLLHPWTYEEGSGFLPLSSVELFKRANQGTTEAAAFVTNSDLYMTGYDFPWEGMTRQYPPAPGGVVSEYAKYYVKIGAASSNPDNNWAVSDPVKKYGYPLRLAAAGDIRLVQIAAFDGDGNPKQVPFHISVYYENDVGVSNMPVMLASDSLNTPYPATQTAVTWSGTNTVITFTATAHGFEVNDSVYASGLTGPYAPESPSGLEAFSVKTVPTANTFTVEKLGATGTATGSGYVTPDAGRHYPFFPNAWESMMDNGTRNTSVQQVTAAATLIVGYGSYYEKAGYWPSSSTVSGAVPSGYLVDETGFNFNFVNATGPRITDQPSNSYSNSDPRNVTCTVMIYCDQEWDGTQLVPLQSDVYFLGRFFRKEPGQE